MPNQETVNDEAKLIMHRMIAREVGRDPAVLSRARARLEDIEREHGEVDWVEMWKEILALDVLEIRHRMVARDELSYWLRISSPFSTVTSLPLDDLALRRRIWRDAKRLVIMRETRQEESADDIQSRSYAG